MTTHFGLTDDEDMGIVKDFAYICSVNSNGGCSHEIKRRPRLRGQWEREWGRSPRAKTCH